MQSQNLQTLFYILIFAGIILICAEIFVPGAVLGAIGGVILASALVVAFFVYPAPVAVFIAILMVLLLGVAIFLWVKLFPKSRMGKAMTLSNDGRDFKSADGSFATLAGKEGVTASELRPSGFALIDGRRTDVITEGEMVGRGERVRVVRVEGNRVIVKRMARE